MKVRRTARVILLDEADRVLLMRIHAPDVIDPDDGRSTPILWVTLGGRIEEGESILEAAHREIIEETGISSASLLGEVWCGEQTLEIDGTPTRFIEKFVLARCQSSPWNSCGWSESERRSILDLRFWSVEELLATNEVVKPPGLGELIRSLLDDPSPKVRQIALK